MNSIIAIVITINLSYTLYLKIHSLVSNVATGYYLHTEGTTVKRVEILKLRFSLVDIGRLR